MTFKFLDEDLAPSIIIPQKTLYDIEDICDIHERWEVGWMGEAYHDPETNEYRLGNVRLPEQEVHSTTTEISTDGLYSIDEDPDMDSDAIRYWGHSHVKMGVTPSGQDDETMQFWAKMCEFFVGTIHNKDGKIYGYIIDKAKNLYLKDVPVFIERYEGHVPTRDWKADFEKNVSEKKYKASTHKTSGGNYGKNSFWTSKEQENKTSSNGQDAKPQNSQVGHGKVYLDDVEGEQGFSELYQAAASGSEDWLAFGRRHKNSTHRLLKTLERDFGVTTMELLQQSFPEGPNGFYYLAHYTKDATNTPIAIEVVTEEGFETACFILPTMQDDKDGEVFCVIVSEDEFDDLLEEHAKGTLTVKILDCDVDITVLEDMSNDTAEMFSLVTKSYIREKAKEAKEAEKASASDAVVKSLPEPKKDKKK